MDNTANMKNIEFEDCKKESEKLRELSEQLLYVGTVISSLNVDGIDVQCSPHIRELKVISSLIYGYNTKVKWLSKRLYDLLNSGPSTHVLLKDRKNLLHIAPNYEGKVALSHILKEGNKWCLYGYCLINLSKYEVRD